MSHPARYLPRLALTAVVAVIATVVFALPTLLLSFLRSVDRFGVSISRGWAWSVSKAMGLTFSLHGKENVVPGASYIVTPNHQGNADILALICTMPFPFRWVIKRELLAIPLFGWTLGRIGAISLNRSDRTQAVTRLQQASDKLSGGWSVLIYPEGTRTRDGALRPFKKGAFMLAVQTGIPILPVAHNGAFKIMPRSTVRFRPGHISVMIGEPIPTEGLTEADVPALMEKTREAIQAHLDPDFDPFDEELAKRLKEPSV